MKRIPSISAMLLALCASIASSAPGLNLGWNLACPTTSASAGDMQDPCDSNANSHTLIGSVRAPAGLSKVTAEELVIDLQESGSQLSPWWHLEDVSSTSPGGCRGTNPPLNDLGSLSVTADFTGASTAICKDYWGHSCAGGFQYLPGLGAPCRARLQALFARTAGIAGPLTANVQYYVMNLRLDTQHTVEDPSDPTVYVCPGCLDPAGIVFDSCKFDQPPGTQNGDVYVTSRDLRQIVYWQGGLFFDPCSPAVPTHRATWGKVKSLYR